MGLTSAREAGKWPFPDEARWRARGTLRSFPGRCFNHLDNIHERSLRHVYANLQALGMRYLPGSDGTFGQTAGGPDEAGCPSLPMLRMQNHQNGRVGSLNPSCRRYEAGTKIVA